MVATFLAILELVKANKITAENDGEEIVIEKVDGAEFDEAEFVSDFENNSEVNENEKQ